MKTYILNNIKTIRRSMTYGLCGLSILLVGCEEPDIENRVDFCRGRNDAYFVGGTWAPYTIYGKTYTPQKCYYYDQVGTASWYGAAFHGKKTASGQTYDQHKMTAAHRTLPIPCLVKVTNLKNKKSVIVLVTDRGPYVPGKSTRILDLSKGAFQKIADIRDGVAHVRIQVLEQETRKLISTMSPKTALRR